MLAALLTAAALAGTWVTGNSVATGDQDNVAIAFNRNGHVAIVWEDDRDATNAADPVHSEVFLRVFKDGVSLFEKKLSAGGTSNWRHVMPDVGLDDKGNAVVVWAEDADGNGFYNIAVRVVAPNGTIVGSARANANTAGQQIEPAVGVDPDGAPNTGSTAFTVAWQDETLIKAAGFKSITSKTFETTVSQTTGTHRLPDVAASASGNAVIVWDEDGDANGSYNVGLIRLNASGAVNLSRRIANLGTAGDQLRASVASTFNGEFAVSWQDTRATTPRVYARGFAANGAAGYADVAVGGDAGAQTSPSVGISDQQDIVVAWTAQGTDLDVWARGLNADGSGDGRLALGRLGTTSTGLQSGMVTAVSPWSEVGFAYTDDNDNNTFDQVMLGLDFANTDW